MLSTLSSSTRKRKAVPSTSAPMLSEQQLAMLEAQRSIPSECEFHTHALNQIAAINRQENDAEEDFTRMVVYGKP